MAQYIQGVHRRVSLNKVLSNFDEISDKAVDKLK
jgi:hypothetical protein